eukprot:COSAG01_NODE_3787_length_5693_cov_17.714337_6_plen_81_part_00
MSVDKHACIYEGEKGAERVVRAQVTDGTVRASRVSLTHSNNRQNQCKYIHHNVAAVKISVSESVRRTQCLSLISACLLRA